MATPAQNLSYTLGYNVGRGVSEQLASVSKSGIKLNNSEIISGFSSAMNQSKPKLTDAQMREAMSYMQTEMQDAQTKKLNAGVLKDQAFFTGKSKKAADLALVAPIYNYNSKTKVVVTEFFDYQCVYCHKVYKKIDKIMMKNKHNNVAFQFVEYPIFSSRWAPSKTAAKMGLYIYQTYGITAYIHYHDALFATGKMEGQLKDTEIMQVAKSILTTQLLVTAAKITKTKPLTTQAAMELAKKAIHSKAYDQLIESALKFGVGLGFNFTPVVVVMPVQQKGTTLLSEANIANQMTVMPGYVKQPVIQQAIDKILT